MKKKIHLICNAHLDPIWQWEWEEGAASALSTFKSAADLCREFDYIFCHNEVTLYKYIEEYAPELFTEIQKLIKEGKWKIIGGWYLQPDCNMPCGESIIRQIQFGKKYFKEKFGAFSNTAFNIDAFGHSVGNVQIMKKCGQDNCFIVRRGDDPIHDGQLIWKGLDGSEIKLCAPEGSYNSPLGGAAKKIKRLADDSLKPVDCVLWGVGNHGGGPSRKDLRDIKQLIETSEHEILHSTAEDFFNDIEPQHIHDKSFEISMPGCYTSYTSIKQSHASFEDTLYMTEKLCAVAAMKGLIEYPEAELNEATEDLLTAEFHDVLPGTCIKEGEENGLMILSHGRNILNKLRARAYFALTSSEPKAKDGEYPFLVFNPNPYKWETEVECEFMLADQNWNGNIISSFKVVDSEGNDVPAQFIKEKSHLNLDWRKRVIFKASLEPMAISRYSVYVEFVENTETLKEEEQGNIIFENEKTYFEINRKTGLVSSYKVNGKEILKDEAFYLAQYDDNADPWAMGSFQLKSLGTNKKRFTLSETPSGVFAGMKSIQVIEDGEIILCVEGFFECENSRARVEYKLRKLSGELDVAVDLFPGDINKMYRLCVPCNINGEYRGQTSFGTQPLYMNGRECVAQRFTYIKGDNECVALLNKGTYGSKYEDGIIEMSLTRTATYCAHPILDRPLIPLDRYTQKMDVEEKNFSFKLVVCNENELERKALEFTTPPYACNVFPTPGETKASPFSINIENKNIVLTTFKKMIGTEKFVLRFVNNSSNTASTAFSLNESEINMTFTPFEAKTVVYNGKELAEVEEMMV